MSKLVPLLFTCGLLLLQLYLGFIFSFSLNQMFLLLNASLKILFTLIASSFKLLFLGTIPEIFRAYYLFCIDEPILVCYQQYFYDLFQFLRHQCYSANSIWILFNWRNDVWFHAVSLRTRKVSHNKSIFPIGYLPAFLYLW